MLKRNPNFDSYTLLKIDYFGCEPQYGGHSEKLIKLMM